MSFSIDPQQCSPPIRDRIKDLRRVKASDLTPNSCNWRKHTQTPGQVRLSRTSQEATADRPRLLRRRQLVRLPVVVSSAVSQGLLHLLQPKWEILAE